MYGGTIEPVLKAVNELSDQLNKRGAYHDKYRERFLELPDDIFKVRDLVVEWTEKELDVYHKEYVEIKKKIVDQTYPLSRTIWP